MSSTSKGNGLISRAVREALSTLVAPPICEQLIRRSLKAHGLSDVPEQGPLVAEWLESSLKVELEETVGSDAAELLMAQLSPMAAYAALQQPRAAIARGGTPTPARGQAALNARAPAVGGPGDRYEPRSSTTAVGFSPEFEQRPVTDKDPTRPFRIFEAPPDTGVFGGMGPHATLGVERVTLASEPDNANELRDMMVRTLPPTNHPSPFEAAFPKTPFRIEANFRRESEFVCLPLVLAATLDQDHLSALELYLEGTAAVTMVGDLASLLDVLSQPTRSERLLLLDCMHPSVHVNSVAAIRQDLPPGTTVVVWGIDEASWAALERDKSGSSRWVRCSQEASTDDVGSLCAMLLG
ncbi:MAG: hypothetical protein QM778_02800 [Myxococcales bacterium]